MQTRTVERVEAWDSRPFSGGAAALASLASDDFSGAVVADDVWLFFVNGRPVGVYGGAVEDVAAASGAVYEAPDLSLPLLFAMLEADGETRAQYYTNDTPLAETDETLESAGFTGYLELSENVLSGDYFLAYYGGRSLPAAFVGHGPEVLTGEEAFERAADEVGVYEVVSVDLDFPDLPEVEESSPDAGAAAVGADDADATDEADDATAVAASPDAASEREPERDPGAGPLAASADATDADAVADDGANATDAAGDDAPDDAQSAALTGPRTESVDETDAAGETGDVADADADPEAASAAAEAARTTDRATTDAQRDADEGRAAAESAGRTSEMRSTQSAGVDAGASEESAGTSASERERPASGAGVFDEEEEWRETTRVPALAPDDTADTSEAAGAPAARETTPTTATRATPSDAESNADAGAASDGRVEALRDELDAREARIEELEADLEAAEESVAARERDLEDVRAERDDLRETVERLEARIAELEADLEATEEAARPGPGDLSPAEALAGTNLFVRYESKAEPTLDALGEADPDAIDANLTLEHHTTFETEDATVDGEPYESFLEGTAAYRFVSWAVRDLPAEILDTGHESGLGDLYEAIPRIDRAELDGTVELDGEEGESVRRDFDVVLRDRMGEPLVVAALNTSRDPVTGGQMEELAESAAAVADLAESLGAALYVTASFFEPDALEVADGEAASGGILRRSEKESYVKVSRKRGYHLCLVEDRNGSFHVTVPEL